ncbi:MAG: hypothetical protein JJU36_09870 [Phycisphaeraceae bacterium]|nr:hypothetical protein [Phycisphaeraceae bacterium]
MMNKPVKHSRPFFPLLLIAVLLACGAAPAFAAQTAKDVKKPVAARVSADDEARRLNIMDIDEVRIGMRGYGLTVFNGAKIEPFELEVISVNRQQAPGRASFWIVSDDPRLELSGPVMGMSGSPIYLWEKGEEKELGEGGRLAGAFAFGYMGVRRCYAGITPIAEMLRAADRTPRLADLENRRPVLTGRPDPRPAIQLMIDTAQRQTGNVQPWRANSLIEALDQAMGSIDSPTRRDPLPAPPAGLAGQDGHVQRLMMPVAFENAEIARMFAPLLEPHGLMAVSGAGATTGLPPLDIDPDSIKLEPGSMVTIPFAFGDLSLAASGTVTHIMPDGRVLAFGHGMDGIGDTEMPMSTGFVHFIVPRYQGSFKLSGSAQMQGAILRDESTAVIGKPGLNLKTSPLEVEVHIPGQPVRTFNYQMLRNPNFIGQMLGLLVVRSAISEQGFPEENTVRLRGTLEFEGDEKVEIDTTTADASPMALMMAIAPFVNSLANNPFDQRLLTGAKLRVDVEPEIRYAAIIGARVDRRVVAPGENLVVRVGLRPFRAETIYRNLEIPIPQDLSEGSHTLVLASGESYLRRWQQLNPHRSLIRDSADLLDVIRNITRVRDDELIALLPHGPMGVAVDRTELPNLPGSRAAMLAPPSPERTVRAFRRSSETVFPMPFMVSGSVEVSFTVSRDAPPY